MSQNGSALSSSLQDATDLVGVSVIRDITDGDTASGAKHVAGAIEGAEMVGTRVLAEGMVEPIDRKAFLNAAVLLATLAMKRCLDSGLLVYRSLFLSPFALRKAGREPVAAAMPALLRPLLRHLPSGKILGFFRMVFSAKSPAFCPGGAILSAMVSWLDDAHFAAENGEDLGFEGSCLDEGSALSLYVLHSLVLRHLQHQHQQGQGQSPPPPPASDSAIRANAQKLESIFLAYSLRKDMRILEKIVGCPPSQLPEGACTSPAEGEGAVSLCDEILEEIFGVLGDAGHPQQLQQHHSPHPPPAHTPDTHCVLSGKSLVSLDASDARNAGVSRELRLLTSASGSLYKVVYLSDNALSCVGDLPPRLAPSLTHLYVQNNGITSLKGVRGFTQLRKLYATRNHLRGLRGIEPLANLEELHASHQGCEDAAAPPAHLSSNQTGSPRSHATSSPDAGSGGCGELQLDLGEGFHLTPESGGGSVFEKLRRLRVLMLAGVGLDDASLDALSHAGSVEQLDISGNRITSLPALLRCAESLRSVRELCIAGNPVAKASPKIRDRLVAALPSLALLDGVKILQSEREYIAQISRRRQSSACSDARQSSGDAVGRGSRHSSGGIAGGGAVCGVQRGSPQDALVVSGLAPARAPGHAVPIVRRSEPTPMPIHPFAVK